MEKSKVYLFIFDGYSDWEPSYAIAEINQSKKFHLFTLALDKKPIKSVGGLTIIPDVAIEDVDLNEVAVIIIPGGTAWEEKKYREIIPFLETLNKQKGKIAAICSATTLLGDMGLLENIQHTSNAKFYLKQFVPSYKGESMYREQPAVAEKNIITANGTAPVEFAREIFKSLSLMDDAALEKWFQLFKHGIWVE